MIVDSQGYIHVVFGGHGGYWWLGMNRFGAPGTGRQIHAVSKRPRDIREWEILSNISPFGTYSQFVKINTDIYLFYRHGSHNASWVYQKSTDDGRSFSRQKVILQNRLRRFNLYDTYYAWFDEAPNGKIVGIFSYHPHKIINHNNDRFDAYYIEMDPATGKWTNAQGDEMKLPIRRRRANRQAKIFDSGKQRSNVGTCHLDSQGRPHLTFRFDGRLRFFRFDNGKWSDPIDVSGLDQGQSGDFIINGTNVTAYLTADDPAGGGRVATWRSPDSGTTWQSDKVIIQRSSSEEFFITCQIRNAHPDALFLARDKDNSRNHLYCRMFVLGENGPLPRPERSTKYAPIDY